MTDCLKQLQRTNPNLLLTSSQLRKAERDSRYVPAVVSALASIISKSSYFTTEFHNIVCKLEDSNGHANNVEVKRRLNSNWNEPWQLTRRLLHENIEQRLRLVISEDGRRSLKKKERPQKTMEEKDQQNDNLLSQPCSSTLSYSPDIDWTLLNDENEKQQTQETNETSNAPNVHPRKSPFGSKANDTSSNQAFVITPIQQLKMNTSKFDDWL
jgi:hypothetical protein